MQSPQDALSAIGGVIEALGMGEVTPSEANAVCSIISQYVKAYEMTEIDSRLTELENLISIKRAA